MTLRKVAFDQLQDDPQLWGRFETGVKRLFDWLIAHNRRTHNDWKVFTPPYYTQTVVNQLGWLSAGQLRVVLIDRAGSTKRVRWDELKEKWRAA